MTKSIINFVWLLIFHLGIASSVKSNLLRENILYLKDFGAIENDLIDDSEAFLKVFNLVKNEPGNYKICLPDGILLVNNPIYANELSGSITLKGQKNTKIQVGLRGFGLIEAKYINGLLKDCIQRGDKEVRYSSSILKRDFSMFKNAILHIQSNSIYETAWKYKENDILRVQKIEKGKILLKDKALFNYDPEKETVKLNLYLPCRVNIESIQFFLSHEKESSNSSRVNLIVFRGVSLASKDLKCSYMGNKSYFHVGFSLVGCVDISFSDVYMEGFMYGVLFNYCRNIEATRTVAISCRHAYTPAQATINVKVEDLRGEHCHSVMDAHQAFNVHYKKIVDTLATQFPNCRSLGTFIEDARIYIAKTAYQDYAYWSVQTLTKEYEPIYKEYDTRFLRVNYVVPRPSAFNGLTSFTCRNLVVEDCTTSSIAYYGDQNILQKVKVTDSRVGVIRIDGQKTEVTNTVLDGRLFPEANYVFRFTGSGETHLNGVRVQNYDPSRTFLFDMFYNQPAMNKMVISNSSIGKLRGFANKLVYPGMKYDNIEFKASTIENFRERVNAEFPKVSQQIKNRDKN